ncbi:hypothetical protein N7492_004202 [Penicillium capsulatum]|uniref:Uncharacterized protein n=1 Tax=Penicillium capsulatum TaxID=69766 RepID=A0A9W9LPT5_9EURO|nr:hypothetical protein N7492_004202 [Penicillium capsulatum]
MTTGRINQITRVRRGAAAGREAPGSRPPSTPGGVRVHIVGWGARSARPPRPPRRTGDGAGGHPIAPTKPLSAGPHADGPSPPLWQAGVGRPCGIRPSGGGSGPHGHAGERRLPRGGSLRESRCQAWPAAIRPQTPSAPGTSRSPGFGHRGRPPAPGEGRRRRGARRVSTPGAGGGPSGARTPAPERRSIRYGKYSGWLGADPGGRTSPLRGGVPSPPAARRGPLRSKSHRCAWLKPGLLIWDPPPVRLASRASDMGGELRCSRRETGADGPPSTGGRDRRAGPTHTPGKPVRNETARVWRDEVTLASTHTLRPCLELDTPCIHESAQKWLAGNELTMGVGPRDGRGRPPRHPPAPPRHPLGTAVGIPAPERAPPRHRRACWGRRGAAAARLAGEGVRGTGGVEIYLWDPGRPDDGGGVHWGVAPTPVGMPGTQCAPASMPAPNGPLRTGESPSADPPRASLPRVPPAPPPAPGRPAPPPPVPPPWPAANWRPRAALQRPAVTPSPTRRPRPPAHAPIAAPPTGRPPRPCRGAAGPAPRPGDPGRPPCAAERPLPRAPRAPHPPGRPRRGVSASLSTQTLRPRLESDTPCIHESAQKWLAGNELTMGVGPRDGRGHVRAHRMSARPRPRRGLDSAPARATAARGPAGTAPLQAPGAAGALDGEQQGYLTAYTTRLVTSVVCRGSIPARGDIAIRQPAPGGFSPGAVASLLRCVARRPIRIQLRRAGRKSPRSGTDSDLEAFSHYPADGSVAALPGQTAAKTNYLNQRFLSY